MLHIVFDCEADGPFPPTYSMLSFGAVLFEDQSKTFYEELAPISDNFIPQALAVNGFTREQTLNFREPPEVIAAFDDWLTVIRQEYGGAQLRIVTDTPSFDVAFLNYYMHTYVGSNQFGHSSLSLQSIYKGMKNDVRANMRHLRKTKHTHNALDDAKGNAEALAAMVKQGFRIDGKEKRGR